MLSRLTVQLTVNGVTPLEIGLDDYYLDREKTRRDARGEDDFEAPEALDLPLLRAHLARLLASETVTTARFNFFRVFIQPATGLPFDRLTRVNVSDLRLLRRIIRDRRHRGTNAAANIQRWPSVRAGEKAHIFPYLGQADAVFDTALVYELSVLKVFADRYLLEVPQDHPSFATAHRLRQLLDRFITIYPDHMPPTSILRECIGGSGFEH